MYEVKQPPRMMTIREAARTGVMTEYALRAGVKRGWVPHVKAGEHKVLVNYDKLIAKLEGC